MRDLQATQLLLPCAEVWESMGKQWAQEGVSIGCPLDCGQESYQHFSFFRVK
jgi:hypothetical protein